MKNGLPTIRLHYISPYDFSVWQYTSTGKVDGIKGDVDLNVSMKDWGNEE